MGESNGQRYRPSYHTSLRVLPRPDVRAAFWRAEQDLGDDYAALILTDHPRTLDGGAAALLTGAPRGRYKLKQGEH